MAWKKRLQKNTPMEKLLLFGNLQLVSTLPFAGEGQQVCPMYSTQKIRPWVNMENAGSKEIEEQVKKCPSGALDFYYNENNKEETVTVTDTKIEVMPDGPLLVYGNIIVKNKSGEESRKSKVTAFCRCGHSLNKPYCDGSHIKQSFKD